ncbi:unnamed protein product [Closterium sp. Naga37s-1]|nr:unnamed protein product [Closterium sp. Naga37s-1]
MSGRRRHDPSKLYRSLRRVQRLQHCSQQPPPRHLQRLSRHCSQAGCPSRPPLRPLLWLTPTRSNGKVVGDKGATGRVVMKGVDDRASASAFYVVINVHINNIRSGGAGPSFDTVSSCLAGKYEAGSDWKNATTTKGGRRKRYSFTSYTSGGRPGRYNTRAGPVEGKLNVHLVAHSHDDVGWLKTVDQYYIGSNNSIQVAAVQYILDTVVEQLSEDPNRKFIQTVKFVTFRAPPRALFAQQRRVVRARRGGDALHGHGASDVPRPAPHPLLSPHTLLPSHSNGGWCMHDEAATHYTDMVHQMSLGLRLIRRQFGQVPRVAWQIDPFGHSAVQGYLISAMVGSAMVRAARCCWVLLGASRPARCSAHAQSRLRGQHCSTSSLFHSFTSPFTPLPCPLSPQQGGFDAVFFARADYEDSEARYRARTAEFVWRASDTLKERAEVFGGRLYVHYLPPDSFRYDTNNWDPPVQDDPELYDYNVQERVDKFVETALKQAESYRTNHIMWTMGDDFAYSNAVTWFRNMDKLIHYVNRDGRVNAFYSTPSIYVDAKHRANESWPLKTGDFFPYADCPHCYWTGYFSSRPAFKRYVRHCSALLLAARQVEALVGRSRLGRELEGVGVGGEGQAWGVEDLEEAMAVAQHHDSVSGTAKQHVNDDYTIRLYRGAVKVSVAGTGLLLTRLKCERHGTAKQHDNADYTLRLYRGAAKASSLLTRAIRYMISRQSDADTWRSQSLLQQMPRSRPIRPPTSPLMRALKKRGAAAAAEEEEASPVAAALENQAGTSRQGLKLSFELCPLANISFCPPSQTDLQDGKVLVVAVYNPLAWARKEVVRFPVSHPYPPRPSLPIASHHCLHSSHLASVSHQLHYSCNSFSIITLPSIVLSSCFSPFFLFSSPFLTVPSPLVLSPLSFATSYRVPHLVQVSTADVEVMNASGAIIPSQVLPDTLLLPSTRSFLIQAYAGPDAEPNAGPATGASAEPGSAASAEPGGAGSEALSLVFWADAPPLGIASYFVLYKYLEGRDQGGVKEGMGQEKAGDEGAEQEGNLEGRVVEGGEEEGKVMQEAEEEEEDEIVIGGWAEGERGEGSSSSGSSALRLSFSRAQGGKMTRAVLLTRGGGEAEAEEGEAAAAGAAAVADVGLEWAWYNASDGKASREASGAYIFRPFSSVPVPITPPNATAASLRVVRGALVDEVHRQVAPWIHEVRGKGGEGGRVGRRVFFSGTSKAGGALDL